MRLFNWASSSNLGRLVGLICLSTGLSNTCDALSLPGAYIQLQGGGGGLQTQNYPENSDPYDQVSLRDGLAYRISAGYLVGLDEFNFGGELGYAGYPKNTYSFSFPSLPASGVQSYKGNTLDLLGVLKLNLKKIVHHDVYLMGKGGIAFVNQTFNGQSTALDTVFALNTTVRHFEPELVGGVGYLLGKNIDLNVSYHHVFTSGSANPFADPVVDQNLLTQLSVVDLLLVGIAYHFSC